LVTGTDKRLIELKNLLRRLQNDIVLNEVYLFGSCLEKDDYNDIDVALVSDEFSGIRFYDIKLIAGKLKKYSSIFDLHPFKTEEFYDQNNYFAGEIIKKGTKFNWT
jgi:predicted nucleotidyltransferase